MLPRPTRFTVALSLAFFMGFTPLAIAWQDDDKVPANPGKKETRPHRKMGHVTILDSDIPRLLEKVEQVKRILKVVT